MSDRARRVRGIDDSDDDGDERAAVASPQRPAAGGSDAGSDEGSDEGEGDRASDSDPDSSEEDEEDDEEEMAEVRKDFIVDDDDDEDEEDDDRAGRRSSRAAGSGDESSPAAERKRRPKRRRPRSEEAAELDQDDLDLVHEATGGASTSEKRFKRLKRTGGAGEGSRRDLKTMFDDDEEDEDEDLDDEADEGTGRSSGRYGGEFDDFIEDDVSDDEEERQRQEQLETQTRSRGPQRTQKGLAAFGGQLSGLDEDQLGEIYEVFGDGEMYDWALEGEDDLDEDGRLEDEDGQGEKALDLQDVFEPSELAARMLTAEDNNIRATDLPERYQLLRQKLKHGYELSDQEFQEKKQWVADKVLEEKKDFLASEPELEEALRVAAVNVVQFISIESFEVPYIWHHRQDYLQDIKIVDTLGAPSEDPDAEPAAPIKETTRTQLLSRDDLWRIVDLDMDFHYMLEKRKSAKELWASLAITEQKDVDLFNELFSHAQTIVEYQDLMDFLQFQYSSILRSRVEGSSKRHSRFGVYDRIRSSQVYDILLETQISVENFTNNLEVGQRVKYVSDPSETPEALSKRILPAADVTETLNSVQDMLATEFFYHPKTRKYFRQHFEREAKVDILVTEDGKKRIDDHSPFADIKYAINWSFEELRSRPELYLRMLAAEQQGLVVVRVQYPNYKTTLFEDTLVQFLFSDNQSDVGAEWNQFRRKVLKQVSHNIVPLISRNIRENLRTDSIRVLATEVRKRFVEKLDQAPFKPPGFVAGTVPRVLAISAGLGQPGKDAILAVVLDEDGNLIENIKFSDPRDAKFRAQLVELVNRRNPDIIGIAGYSVHSRRVHQIIEGIVKDEQLTSGDQGEDPLAVHWVQDEVARIYRNSMRAETEYTDLVPVARYCVGLARYVQSPILEYAALGREISSITIHEDQALLPDESFRAAIESAFVDYSNLTGLDVNLAARNPYIANVVPFIAGLGPRKASGIIQAIQARGGSLSNRTDLVTKELMGKTVWVNCASFFKIPQESSAAKEDDSDPLDSTRIHPEDYNLARKMAADSLELDEEDIEAYENNGSGGVVAQLFMDDVEKLDELVLEDFAATLEAEFHQKKLITLETIRAELKDNYKELRAPLAKLSDLDVFTMLSGESKKTLKHDAVVSAVVRKATNRQLFLTLNSGVDAIAESGNISDDRSQPITALFQPSQAVRAVILNIDYKSIFAVVSTRSSVVQEALEREERTSKERFDPSKWDSAAEQRDIDASRQKVAEEQRRGRIIKHPLFRLFNAKQAEEYLAPLQRGDLIIRPSSRGNDHIAITWKVGEMMYQHIDVTEFDKDNEYSLGKVLQVGKWRYSDLDELIIMHIQTMARKVDEMTQNDKFQAGSKADVDKWLTAYTNARPRQSVYAYCFDHRHPGYFLLCFKTGAAAEVKSWPVKVIPNGYELLKNSYPDVSALNNGFKMVFQSRA